MILLLLLFAVSYLGTKELMVTAFLLMFYLKFTVSAPHSLLMLLSLEVLMVCSLLALCGLTCHSPSSLALVFMTLSVVEACLGLSLLISLSRQQGSDLIGL